MSRIFEGYALLVRFEIFIICEPTSLKATKEKTLFILLNKYK